MNRYFTDKTPSTRPILIIVLLIGNLVIASAQNSALPQSSISAIVRSDNSFVSYNDTLSKREQIPQIIKKRIIKIYNKYDDDPFFEKNLRPIIFKVNYATDIDIYIIKVYFIAGVSYKFLAFNHKSRKFGNSISINGGPMENAEEGFAKEDRLLCYPYIYFADITKKGNKNIIIKERVHNGTIYNGEVDHFFSLDRNMNLMQVLCIESKLIDYNNGCVINRVLKSGKIICELVCNQKKPLIIGEVYLNLLGFPTIINKKSFIKEYTNVLITGSNVDEKKFLKYGSSYSY